MQNMIIDFIIGVMLMGSLFHISFGIWNVKVLSPFGSSKKSNLLYGIFVLGISQSLYLYKNGLNELMQDKLYLGGLFALFYTVLFGLWVTGKVKTNSQ